MRKKIICLLPKSPLPKKGRILPNKLMKWQNWYKKKAKDNFLKKIIQPAIKKRKAGKIY